MRVVCTFWRGIESVRPFSCGFLRNPEKTEGRFRGAHLTNTATPCKGTDRHDGGENWQSGQCFSTVFSCGQNFLPPFTGDGVAN